MRETGCKIWIANSLFLTFHLTTSNSLQTPAQDTSSYVDTIEVSHSSTEKLERVEIEEGDETLNEGLEVSDKGRKRETGGRRPCKEYMKG